MLFKLNDKCGGHRDVKGNVYVAGDTVPSDRDLAKEWPTKFTKISGSESQETIPSAPNIPAPAKKDEGSVESETTLPKSEEKVNAGEKVSEYGKEVTGDFLNAKKTGFKIFEKGNWYTVVDANDGEKMNEKALRKKDVQTFLDKYIAEPAEDEDEDEDEDEEA